MKEFMGNKLWSQLNCGRHGQGMLKGSGPFMNLLMDERVGMATSRQQNNVGMMVMGGSSTAIIEALARA
ncbi:small nuclear ribonucleoprotein G-like [Vulpes lagopus]|nr:small nuclear ribonucleoprotein G-like [Vulpes lagopus]